MLLNFILSFLVPALVEFLKWWLSRKDDAPYFGSFQEAWVASCPFWTRPVARRLFRATSYEMGRQEKLAMAGVKSDLTADQLVQLAVANVKVGSF